MDWSGQLYAPAASSPRKECPVRTEKEAGWPQPVWMMCRREKSDAPKLSLPVLPENFSEFAYRHLSWLVWKNRSLTGTIFVSEEVDGHGFGSDFNTQFPGFGDIAFFLFFFALEA